MSRSVVFLLAISMVGFNGGCSVGSALDPHTSRPAATSPVEPPPPPCDNMDLERLEEDLFNCGSCGFQCNIDDADRCVDNICMCGINNKCGEGFDCYNGSCIESDRFQVCNLTADCVEGDPTGKQECLMETSVSGFCVDVCEFDLQCSAGYACIEGACSFAECVPEVCDGLDNDCDGEIDENSDSTGPLTRWCSNQGNPRRLALPCRDGSQICEIGGTWSDCTGEILPSPEQGTFSCNQLDDDCDGCIDGRMVDGRCVQDNPTGFDILYLIDNSGSMSSTIEAVKMATASFSEAYSDNPEFRFGLVLFSGDGNLESRAYISVDFTEFTTFDSVLSDVEDAGGSFEASYDAVYESATNTIGLGIDTLGDGVIDDIYDIESSAEVGNLSWRDGSIRIMILFTDEPGQTWRERTRDLPSVTEARMCNSMTHGETLAVFGNNFNRHGFGNVCGTFYNLTLVASEMVASLQSIIIDPCL